jgi:hypothetical protein
LTSTIRSVKVSGTQIDHPVSQTFLSAVDEHVSYGNRSRFDVEEHREVNRAYAAPRRGGHHPARGPDADRRRRAGGGAVTQTRPICLYPEVAASKGYGDVAAASSFACRRSG